MLEKLNSVFLEEASDLLSSLEDNLLSLESDPENNELISAVFRVMHTIKGSAGMFGFDDISLCSFLTPPLSTMHVPKHELGILAIEQLIRKINTPSRPPIKIELSPRLTLRDSIKEKRGYREINSPKQGQE